MSLLMEALKKAEEDKKRSALEQQSIAAVGDTTGGHGAAAEPASATPGEGDAGARTNTIDTSRLSLEPIEKAATAAPPQAEPADDSGTTRFDRPTPPEEEEYVYDLSAPIKNLDEIEARVPGSYDQESTVPSERGVKSSLEEYFEPSQSMEQAKVTAAEAATAQGYEGGTPVSAQTVFSAKNRSAYSRWVSSPAILMLALLAVGVSGGWWVWWNKMRTPPTIFTMQPGKSPAEIVAADVEKLAQAPLNLPPVAPPSAEMPPPAPEAAVTPPTTTAETTPAATEPQVQPSPQPGPAPAQNVEAAETAKETAAVVSTAIPAPAPTATANAASEAAAAPARREPAPAARPQVTAAAEAGPGKPEATAKSDLVAVTAAPAHGNEVTPEITVAPGEVHIARSRGVNEVNQGVMQAYAAYQRGDYAGAETFYRTALAKNPGNRDALLGLAAIALRRGDRQEAANTYYHLLQFNPADSVAGAALVALRRQADPVADESTLKLMLERAPASPYLHFILGNIYARQSRWSEAQQAYFDAYSTEKENADYAFNLAVSLDHLGQHDAALDYYRKALDLADSKPTNFAASQAMSRIQALAGTSSP